jgi:hypothetical protein
MFAAAAISGCATVPENPGKIFVGKWEVEIESERGPIEETWYVKEGLVGRITHPLDHSTMDMFHIQVRKNKVSFDAIFDINGESVPATFTGTITDNTILGVYSTQFGDGYVRGLRR